MYAIVESGGRQYRVEPGQKIKLGKIDAEEGQAFDFEKVLMVSDGENMTVGAPHVQAKVSATVVSHGRDKKIRIIKFKRRKHHMKKMGHRQDHTFVQINAIEQEK